MTTGESKSVDHGIFARYLQIKATHPQAILLLRVNDFYEAFEEDARTLVRVLRIRSYWPRSIEKEMAGFPCADAQVYIEQLTQQGYKVVCAD